MPLLLILLPLLPLVPLALPQTNPPNSHPYSSSPSTTPPPPTPHTALPSAFKQPKIIVLWVLAGTVCILILGYLVYKAGFRQRIAAGGAGVWREGQAEGVARGGAAAARVGARVRE